LGDRKGIRPVKTAPKPLSHVILAISGLSTGCSALQQLHLPVSATKVTTGLARFAWKIAVKTMCVEGIILILIVIVTIAVKNKRLLTL